MEELGWSRLKASRHLKDATNAGYIELVDAKKGTAYRYRFKSLPDEGSNILLSLEELQKRTEETDENEVYTCSDVFKTE